MVDDIQEATDKAKLKVERILEAFAEVSGEKPNSILMLLSKIEIISIVMALEVIRPGNDDVANKIHILAESFHLVDYFEKVIASQTGYYVEKCETAEGILDEAVARLLYLLMKKRRPIQKMACPRIQLAQDGDSSGEEGKTVRLANSLTLMISDVCLSEETGNDSPVDSGDNASCDSEKEALPHSSGAVLEEESPNGNRDNEEKEMAPACDEAPLAGGDEPLSLNADTPSATGAINGGTNNASPYPVFVMDKKEPRKSYPMKYHNVLKYFLMPLSAITNLFVIVNTLDNAAYTGAFITVCSVLTTVLWFVFAAFAYSGMLHMTPDGYNHIRAFFIFRLVTDILATIMFVVLLGVYSFLLVIIGIGSVVWDVCSLKYYERRESLFFEAR